MTTSGPEAEPAGSPSARAPGPDSRKNGVWRRLSTSFVAHFERHRRRGAQAFFWWITAESMAVSAVLALGFRALISEPAPAWASSSRPSLFAQLVLLAPVVETLLFQILPVGLARWARAGFRGQLLAAWLPFACFHFFNGIVSGIAAGVGGGFYLGFAYAHWRERGFGTAVGLTMLSHAVHNAFVFAGGMLSGAL